ncbi:MAG: nitroreductase family protein [Myxococcota bacterium]
MDVFEALYTTRAMRRVKPDPVPEEVQKRILDAAIRAPSGGNAQNWRFLLVDDPEVRGALAPIYQGVMATVWGSVYRDRIEAAEATPETAESIEFLKVKRSADWTVEHFAEIPLLFFGFSQGDPSGGSIFPAIWNAMLAARAQGVGAAITSAFMLNPEPVLEVIGVPKDEGWVFAACVTMGYPTGRWGVAPRRPVHEVSYRNRWGEPVGFEIPEPLFPG